MTACKQCQRFKSNVVFTEDNLRRTAYLAQRKRETTAATYRAQVEAAKRGVANAKASLAEHLSRCRTAIDKPEAKPTIPVVKPTRDRSRRLRQCTGCSGSTKTEHDMCNQCRRGTAKALSGGEWVNDRGVMRWREAPPPPPKKKAAPKPRKYTPTGNPRGRRPQPDTREWTDRQLRLARAQFRRGILTDWTREGNRIYNRLNARRGRAAKRACQQKETT